MTDSIIPPEPTDEEKPVIETGKKKKAKEPKEADTEHGAVLYSDGSCQMGNPGYGGYGFHGYIYSHLPPTKGHGNSTQFLTKDGYVGRAQWGQKHEGKPEEIKPLSYVNGLGSIAGLVSNNVAEIVAASEAMAFAASRGINKLLIKTDSRYTVQGTQDWLPQWKRNHWIKADGQPVSNRGHWEQLDANLSKLRDAGCDVKIQWVKGHSHHLGNQMADKNADYGARFAIKGEVRNEISVEPAEGYWANKVERHPFFFQKYLVFSTEAMTNLPGVYFLGEMEKDEDLIMKRSPDGCFSYLIMAQSNPYIEALRSYQSKVADGHQVVVRARLDKLFHPDVVGDITAYGDMAFVRSHAKRLDLDFIDGEPITRAAQPALLAYRSLEMLNKLQTIHDKWKEGLANGCEPGFAIKEITEVFYERDSKEQTVLKSDFVVGYTAHPVSASYSQAGQLHEASVNLVLGHDCLDRNALKRLEKTNPRIWLVTWMESEKAFRYATVCEAGPDLGVWASFCSNLRLVQPSS